jgi:predicted RNase H-like HicB family nuclease
VKTLSKGKNLPGPLSKNLDYFKSLNYPYTVEEVIEEGKTIFSLVLPDLPGCGAEGKTLDEARGRLEDAKEAWIQTALDAGLSVPEPVAQDDFSGRLLLRIPPKLHMKLAKNAKREDLSLNQYIKSLLEIMVENQSLLGRVQKIEAQISLITKKLPPESKPGPPRPLKGSKAQRRPQEGR